MRKNDIRISKRVIGKGIAVWIAPLLLAVPPLSARSFRGSAAGIISQTPDNAQGNPGLGGGGPRALQFALRLKV